MDRELVWLLVVITWHVLCLLLHLSHFSIHVPMPIAICGLIGAVAAIYIYILEERSNADRYSNVRHVRHDLNHTFNPPCISGVTRVQIVKRTNF
ncbi:unnamed protein product [Rhodiola kirilowii]